MDGKDRFNFGSRVSFRFVSGFSVSRFTTIYPNGRMKRRTKRNGNGEWNGQTVNGIGNFLVSTVYL